MRISPLTGPPAARGASRARRGDQARFDAELNAPSAPEAAGVAAASPLATLDAVLALQADPERDLAREAAIDRGDALLDALEGVRLSLLDGAFDEDALRALADRVGARVDATDDPQLNAVVREIETRAAVELAKIEKARQAV